jgi:hypothetical protein
VPKLHDERLARDRSRLDPPLRVAPGISAHKSSVWAWVVVPDKATDELNLGTQFELTTQTASVLRRLLPSDTEFHIKVQWGEWSADEYRETEYRKLGGRDKATEGQIAYIELGAKRIAANRYPKRQVLIGIRLSDGKGSQLPAALRAAASSMGGEADSVEEAGRAMAAVAQAAWSWHDRMEHSVLQARAATAKEIAWSLRRDLRRTVTMLPEGPMVSGGQMARLLNGCRVDPTQGSNFLVIATDDGDRFLRIVTCAQLGFPSSEMELPGGEWLKDLSVRSEFERGVVTPVEVSVRGRNLPAHEALKIMRDSSALAKEQEREAAQGVAQEPPEDILEARAVLGTRQKEIRQNLVGEVLHCPLWIVEGATLGELDRRTQALIDSYGGRGITLWVPDSVQDVLYKETVLGDHIRFRDVEQLCPMTTLTGSWFYGGSVVGQDDGPYLGGVIGATPRPFRTRLSDAQLVNETVTSAFVGRSRSGKSTAVMLSVLAEVVLDGWGLLTDLKGDLRGIVKAAEMFGVPVFVASSDKASSGSQCAFRYVDDPAEAASMVVDDLLRMLRKSDADVAEHHIRQAADVVADYENPGARSTHAVITLLRTSQNPEAAAIGDKLHTLAKDPLARPIAGAPDLRGGGLPTGPGLVYMPMLDLRMPPPEAPEAGWSAGERISVARLLAAFRYAIYMAGRVKGIAKTVALTELHLITGHPFGRQNIGNLARMGAALDTNLLVDTQAIAELLLITGLVDQLSAVYAFRTDTDAEADAQAVLLGLEPEEGIRTKQKLWSPGQCLARDRHRPLPQVGAVQWDLLCIELAEALSTTPTRDREVAA